MGLLIVHGLGVFGGAYALVRTLTKISDALDQRKRK